MEAATREGLIKRELHIDPDHRKMGRHEGAHKWLAQTPKEIER